MRGEEDLAAGAAGIWLRIRRHFAAAVTRSFRVTVGGAPFWGDDDRDHLFTKTSPVLHDSRASVSEGVRHDGQLGDHKRHWITALKEREADLLVIFGELSVLALDVCARLNSSQIRVASR
jgi:hypothetical protein